MPVAANPQRETRARAVRWSTWLLAVMVATELLYAVDLMFQPMPPAVSELFQKFASNAIFYGAAALCVVRGRAVRADRSAWLLFALAMTLWGTGGFYYAIVLWNADVVPFPSLADFFWIVFYLPAYAALFKLLRSRARTTGRGVLLDALVAGLGVGGASAALAFQVVLSHTEGTVAATATNLAYPLGDLGLLALVVAAITVVGWKAAGLWRWIAPAFVLFAVADSVYMVQVARGQLRRTVALSTSAGRSAAAPGRRGRVAARGAPDAPARVRGPTIVVPGVFGLAALALLAVDHVVAHEPAGGRSSRPARSSSSSSASI